VVRLGLAPSRIHLMPPPSRLRRDTSPKSDREDGECTFRLFIVVFGEGQEGAGPICKSENPMGGNVIYNQHPQFNTGRIQDEYRIPQDTPNTSEHSPKAPRGVLKDH